MNEHLDWNLYFSKLKKKLNAGIGLLAKIRHFAPKVLIEKPLLFIIKLKFNIWLPDMKTRPN